MPGVKRTFSIPHDISTELDATIPKKRRSGFIALSLREALREHKRKQLPGLLSGISGKDNPDDFRSEELLREIRSARAMEIISDAAEISR